MKKLVLCVSALMLFVSALTAQQFKIEKSEAFDEPDYGWNKLLQLKNGNTFYFHAENKVGIEIEVYGKDRKLIGQKTIEGKIWDASQIKRTKILGLYEINGEPVLFMVQADDREPTLYRLRINPANGALVKEENLGHLPKITPFAGYAMLFGNAEPSNIIVEKDPNSDCYAVIFFNGFAHDRNERIKVVHYDGTHKVLNTAFYESPNNQYKYLEYIGSVVDGKRLYITTYASKGHYGKDGEDDAKRVIVSRLDEGNPNFKHNMLEFSEDFDDTKSVMIYNHNSNKIELLTVSLTNKKHKFLSSKTTSTYMMLLSFIDPESLNILSVKPVIGQKVSEYAHAKIDKDYDYEGMPQQMVLNKDNTTTILMEEITTIIQQSGHTTSEKTMLGPIGISELSDAGDELTGYTINKKQQAQGILPKLYLAERGRGIFFPARHGMTKGDVNQFLSFDYINATKGRYVVFNDLPANSDKDEDETKRKTLVHVSESNTMCYKLGSNSVEKSFLFGEPDKREASFCYIECSDFNKDTNIYATMVVEREGRSKQVRIAWVTFD